MQGIMLKFFSAIAKKPLHNSFLGHSGEYPIGYEHRNPGVVPANTLKGTRAGNQEPGIK